MAEPSDSKALQYAFGQAAACRERSSTFAIHIEVENDDLGLASNSKKFRVIYTSNPFADWVYVARKDIGESERQKFAGIMLGLQQGKDDEVLKVLPRQQIRQSQW